MTTRCCALQFFLCCEVQLHPNLFGIGGSGKIVKIRHVLVKVCHRKAALLVCCRRSEKENTFVLSVFGLFLSFKKSWSKM